MKFLGILKNTEDAEGLLQATREFANFWKKTVIITKI